MICLSLALIAMGITLYPLVSNLVSETNRSIIETKYTKAVEAMDDTEIIRARSDAQGYNATLLSVPEKPYTKESLQRAAESYDRLLNIREDGIMGYLEIPVLNLELPIYHGTEESTLDRGLGHLLGSSLPVGGQGTHCVITGHSGLAGRRMFSDLDQLKKGDVFYIKILDETLAYMILDINTVLPEDTSRLTIDPNRDSCTLVTCTPYGVNTHRLLVRGERIAYETAVSAVEDAIIEEAPASTWTQEYLRGIGFGLMGVAALTAVIGTVYLRKRDKKSKARPIQPHYSVPPSSRISTRIDRDFMCPARGRKRSFFKRPERKRGKHEI
ncbi:MAG: class C sortase [Oscillospiraceae bacterium]|nr:class C sortase [Oscillospiraceae bacterium]